LSGRLEQPAPQFEQQQIPSRPPTKRKPLPAIKWGWNVVLALTVLFVGLRFLGKLQWSWLWILSPVWIAFLAIGIAGLVWVGSFGYLIIKIRSGKASTPLWLKLVVGSAGVATLVLALLKALRVVAWSWWYAFSPVLIVLGVLAVVLLALGCSVLLPKKRDNRSGSTNRKE